MRILFERAGPCPRCNGTKVFRCWSHIASGVCFRCAGRGYLLTKRGAKAAAEWQAADRAETLAEVAPGYRVQAGTSGKWHTITAVERIAVSGAWSINPDGSRNELEGLHLTVGKTTLDAYLSPSAFKRPVTAEMIRAFVAAHPGAASIEEVS